MGKIKDLTDKTFGKLKVIKRVGSNKYKKATWLCKCSCGNEIIVVGNSLTSGNTRSCGKCNEIKVGDRFDRLIVIERVENNKYGNAMWLCKCDCGNENVIAGTLLVSGHTKSCGCLRKERMTGKNNPKYKYNKTNEERENDRSTFEDKEFVIKVLNRDNYTCKCCNDRSGGYLEVHHLDGFNWCKEKRTDVKNGITLCKKCHNLFHMKYGKGNNTKEQFEEFLIKYYGKTLDGEILNKTCEEILDFGIVINSYPEESFVTVRQVYDFLKTLGYKINSKSTLKSYINGNIRMPQELYDLGLHRADKKMEDYKVQTEKYKPKKVICNNKVFESISECAREYNIKHIPTMTRWLDGSRKMPQQYIDLGLRYATEKDILTFD